MKAAKTVCVILVLTCNISINLDQCFVFAGAVGTWKIQDSFDAGMERILSNIVLAVLDFLCPKKGR
jgi:hypothetical protein